MVRLIIHKGNDAAITTESARSITIIPFMPACPARDPLILKVITQSITHRIKGNVIPKGIKLPPNAATEFEIESSRPNPAITRGPKSRVNFTLLNSNKEVNSEIANPDDRVVKCKEDGTEPILNPKLKDKIPHDAWVDVFEIEIE